MRGDKTNFLEINESNDFYKLYLIGEYQYHEFIAHYASDNKNKVIEAATENNSGFIIFIGMILFYIGLCYDIVSLE